MKTISRDDIEITKEIDNLMSKIEDKFEWYVQHYRLMTEGDITLDELDSIIENKIYQLSDYEMMELNVMNKMLSTKNCDWMLFKVGEMVHGAIIKKWYPSLDI